MNDGESLPLEHGRSAILESSKSQFIGLLAGECAWKRSFEPLGTGSRRKSHVTFLRESRSENSASNRQGKQELPVRPRLPFYSRLPTTAFSDSNAGLAVIF